MAGNSIRAGIGRILAAKLLDNGGGGRDDLPSNI